MNIKDKNQGIWKGQSVSTQETCECPRDKAIDTRSGKDMKTVVRSLNWTVILYTQAPEKKKRSSAEQDTHPIQSQRRTVSGRLTGGRASGPFLAQRTVASSGSRSEAAPSAPLSCSCFGEAQPAGAGAQSSPPRTVAPLVRVWLPSRNPRLTPPPRPPFSLFFLTVLGHVPAPPNARLFSRGPQGTLNGVLVLFGRWVCGGATDEREKEEE